MKKIWKFSLGNNSANIIVIDIPKEAKLLTVAIQQKCFVIWAEVETEFQITKRSFIIYATGERFLSEDYLKEGKFIGTVFHDAIVWHVYDLGEVG